MRALWIVAGGLGTVVLAGLLALARDNVDGDPHDAQTGVDGSDGCFYARSASELAVVEALLTSEDSSALLNGLLARGAILARLRLTSHAEQAEFSIALEFQDARGAGRRSYDVQMVAFKDEAWAPRVEEARYRSIEEAVPLSRSELPAATTPVVVEIYQNLFADSAFRSIADGYAEVHGVVIHLSGLPNEAENPMESPRLGPPYRFHARLFRPSIDGSHTVGDPLRVFEIVLDEDEQVNIQQLD